MAERNLTHERQLAFLKNQKQLALAQIGPSETVVVPIAKLDAKGAPVLKDGFGVYDDRRIPKRDLVAREHDEKIARFAAQCGLKA